MLENLYISHVSALSYEPTIFVLLMICELPAYLEYSLFTDAMVFSYVLLHNKIFENRDL